MGEELKSCKFLSSPSFKIITPTTEQLWFSQVKQIEYAARTCRDMAWKQDATLDEALVRRLIKDGHHAMLEFGSMTVKITCSRRCSHQIVRHRLFSFAQESQRFTNYTKEVHDMAFILPPSLPADKTECFRNFCREAWLVYQKTVQDNVFPEDAAYLLPEAAVTNLCVKGNFREWRHFFILRMSQKAQLEIRTVAKALLYEIMTTPAKCVFDDLL